MISVGTNRKLGKGCSSWSRPVGPTCPPDCPVMKICYAEAIQNRRPLVRRAWAANMAIEPEDFARELVEADYKVKAHRAHVGGDFCNPDGQLDLDYLENLLTALDTARTMGARRPVWCYTHAWRELAHMGYKRELEDRGCVLFASVGTLQDAIQARAAGYRLAIDPGAYGKGAALPAKLQIFGGTAYTCPEQRKGVTCDRCGLCWRENVNKDVIFWRH